MKVAELTRRVRAKNAGPFKLTIDCFCNDVQAWQQLRDGLGSDAVALALRAEPGSVVRHELPALCVLKFSLPRPRVQGAVGDRDQHGAQWALVVAALSIEPSDAR